MVSVDVASSSYRTKYVSGKDIKKKWLLVDASGLYIGRISSKIANILRGKNKTYYTPFL